jgi:mercuric ion transport protein
MKEKLPIISGIVASITAIIGASCCVIPLVLFNFGIGGAWLSNLAVLQPLRPYLIGLSILALIVGGIIYWRNRSSECAPCDEATTKKRKMSFIFLFALAVLLVGIAIIWPQVEPDLIRALR